MFSIKNNNAREHMINEEIRIAPSKSVRVAGPDNEQLGIMAMSAARSMAYDKGLDLVLIAPTAEPPVVRVMDYGKFRFDRDKREKEAKKKQQVVETKQIELTARIDTNDFNTKLSHAVKFLSDGNKVKVLVKFKGRMVTHQDIGRELLTRFEEGVKEVGVVEKAPLMEGRQLIMILGPIKAVKAPKADKPAAEKPAAKAEKSEKPDEAAEKPAEESKE